jgi:hypothetical protein
MLCPVNDFLSPCRALRPDELAVLEVLLRSLNQMQYQDLSAALVRDKGDGTMGITFIRPDDRKARFSKEIVSAEYVDDDGKTVSMALHVDRAGRLMELDLLKGDFSPVSKLPSPESMQVKPIPAVVNADSQWQTLLKFWRDDIPLRELPRYVLIRAAIILGLWILFAVLQFVMTMVDFIFITGEATQGTWVDAMSYVWEGMLYIVALGFIVTVPIAVWRSVSNANSENARASATGCACLSFMVLVLVTDVRDVVPWILSKIT